MKRSTALLLSACALPLALALATPQTTISFAPAEGNSLTKTFTSEFDMSLDELDMTMNGEPMPVEIEIDMNIVAVSSTVVTDEFVELGKGMPTKLIRSYDEIGSTTSMSMEMSVMGTDQSQDEDRDSSSELEGESVVFDWNEEKSEFAVSFPKDSESDEELLEGLEEDMDFRALLPDGDVSEGDEWKLDPAVAVDILAPGGNLKLVPEDMSEEMEALMGGMGGNEMGDLRDWLEGEIEGSVTCTYVGMREVDGTSLALIEFAVNINTAVDMTDKVLEKMDEVPMPQGAEVELDHMDIEFEMEAKGQLFWNVKAGHFHSFELTGSTAMVMDFGMAMNMGGQEMTMEYAMEMSGTLEMGANAK